MTARLPLTTGQPLATRKLDLYDKNGKLESKVIVKIYKPRPWGKGGSWMCYYKILGMGREKLRYAAGADAIQAVSLALVNIGTNIYASPEAKSGLLKWHGAGNLGFPTFDEALIEAPTDSVLRLFL